MPSHSRTCTWLLRPSNSMPDTSPASWCPTVKRQATLRSRLSNQPPSERWRNRHAVSSASTTGPRSLRSQNARYIELLGGSWLSVASVGREEAWALPTHGQGSRHRGEGNCQMCGLGHWANCHIALQNCHLAQVPSRNRPDHGSFCCAQLPPPLRAGRMERTSGHDEQG